MLSPRMQKKLNQPAPAAATTPANPYTHLDVKQITLALGKTEAEIKTLINRGMPGGGTYNLPAVIDWLVSGAAPTTAGVSVQKAVQDLEIAKLKREKLALEVDDKKDNTIPREERDRDVSALIEAFTSYLRNSIQRNLATLRSVHEADADVVVNQFVQELTSHMNRAVRIK